VIAAVGPGIGFDAFEVGADVLDEFCSAFGAEAPARETGNGKGRVDLREAIRRQLRGAGVGEDSIDLTDRCTFRDAAEFFSHRREKGVTGRMAAVISPRGSADATARTATTSFAAAPTSA
jgi:copper oxidase (laccase) domain-containing protein